jgi:hypothetical protein
MAIFSTLVAAGKCKSGTATALVCYSSDYVASFPTNKGFSASLAVQSQSGSTIASGWATFATGPLTSSLVTAGVSVPSQILTGCTTTGTATSANCQGFTVVNGLNTCSLGASNSAASGWMDGAAATCNNANAPIACVCWN